MSSISPDEAREYLDRWRQVTDAQSRLMRVESMEIRLRQLSTLMFSRELFGSDIEREARAAQVRERWLRMREALRA
jgi:hypothetical protein